MKSFLSLYARVVTIIRALLQSVCQTVRGDRPLGVREECVASANSDGTLVISVIDDPEQPLCLMSVRGDLTISTIDSLVDALRCIDSWSDLHLDVTDATIDSAALIRLEPLTADLEDRKVRLRIVGLRPILSDSHD
jgi:hypothetical protein